MYALPTDENFISAASAASTVPTANSLITVNVTCDGEGSETGTDFPCSPGSMCLDGDVGVFCECYEQRSTGVEVKFSAVAAN